MKSPIGHRDDTSGGQDSTHDTVEADAVVALADRLESKQEPEPQVPPRRTIRQAHAMAHAELHAAAKRPGWPAPPGGQLSADEADRVADAGGSRESRARRDPYVDWQVGPDHDVGAEWRDTATADLMDAIVALPDRAAAERFFRDLCTLKELHDMAQRWHVAQLLDDGRHYLDISRATGASTATVTRISQWLRHGTGGYVEALERARPEPAPAGTPPEPSVE
jgi:TrpR-related protein YerC/YecD